MLSCSKMRPLLPCLLLALSFVLSIATVGSSPVHHSETEDTGESSPLPEEEESEELQSSAEPSPLQTENEDNGAKSPIHSEEGPEDGFEDKLEGPPQHEKTVLHNTHPEINEDKMKPELDTRKKNEEARKFGSLSPPQTFKTKPDKKRKSRKAPKENAPRLESPRQLGVGSKNDCLKSKDVALKKCEDCPTGDRRFLLTEDNTRQYLQKAPTKRKKKGYSSWKLNFQQHDKEFLNAMCCCCIAKCSN